MEVRAEDASTVGAGIPRVGMKTMRLDDLLVDLRAGTGEVAAHALPLVRTGYDVLDSALEGGVRPHDLLLLGGLPGIGKTVVALQWAREMARDGRHVVYACYEHDPLTLLGRLLLLEAGAPDCGFDSAERDFARQLVRERFFGGTAAGIADLVDSDLLVRHLVGQVETYAHRMTLQRASGTHTDLGALADAVRPVAADGAVLFVDYLQKVAVRPEPGTEAEKVRLVAEGLKELALGFGIPVIAVVAADREGLTARRVRGHHLRGSSALAYEADVIVLLNDKMQAVSKVHLAYDSTHAVDFSHWTVFSVEKNRSGQDTIDLEFRKDLRHFRYDPDGRWVSERLVDERIEEA
jgi:replicative DNA helicase